ncbi:hypothetical protein PUN28_018338 [Cardiocondyla obscurior]|uniref:Uncharacterized protein n=1 Tax=Cardiocondyla obscurior TaxID=286306 RepID=A0AAW2EIF2_9HYME
MYRIQRRVSTQTPVSSEKKAVLDCVSHFEREKEREREKKKNKRYPSCFSIFFGCNAKLLPPCMLSHVKKRRKKKKCINRRELLSSLMCIFAYKRHPENHLAPFCGVSAITFVARNNLVLCARDISSRVIDMFRKKITCIGY